MKRVKFNTTLNETLIDAIKIQAIEKKVDVNDILEILISKYLQGEMSIDNELNSIKK